jgi:ABC-type glycerol-3-phosphate transport system substrate-binding protein
MTKQKIILIIGVLFFIFLVSWYIIGCPPLKKCPLTRPPKVPDAKIVILKFVGPYDTKENWAAIAEKFNKFKLQEENGFLNVIIKYEMVTDQINYENNVREMQFEGDGPNIFMAFNSWVSRPAYQEKLLPLPKETMAVAQFENTFAKAAIEDLILSDPKTSEKRIYALPFYIDTPALYYNTDRFANEGIDKAPETWDDFKNYVEKLTIRNENGSIEKTGAAFGGGENVNRSQDIIILLAMQNNFRKNEAGNLTSFNSPQGIAAVKFYTDFADPAKRFYAWDEDQMYSIDAFVQRKTAMMINYSHHIDNIISKDKTLDFKIAPIPQLDKNYKVNYASYWVPVVPKIAPCRSADPKVNCYNLAWEFLNFAAKKENARLYLDSTKRAAANLELAREQASNYSDIRSVFADQVFTARSWEHPYDKESDSALIEMIDSIITKDSAKKQTLTEAITKVKTKVKSLN